MIEPESNAHPNTNSQKAGEKGTGDNKNNKNGCGYQDFYNRVKRWAKCVGEFLNRVSNPVIAVAAITAAVIAYFALIDTRDALQRDQRAWISPGGIKILTPFKQDTYHEVWLSYGNTGKQPAQNVTAQFWAIAIPNNKIRVPNAVDAEIFKAMNGKKCIDLPSDKRSGGVVYPGGPKDGSYRIGVSGEIVSQALTEGYYLMIAGCFSYDTFSKLRHSAFCRFLDHTVPDPEATSMDWRSSKCFTREYAD